MDRNQIGVLSELSHEEQDQGSDAVDQDDSWSSWEPCSTGFASIWEGNDSCESHTMNIIPCLVSHL